MNTTTEKQSKPKNGVKINYLIFFTLICIVSLFSFSCSSNPEKQQNVQERLNEETFKNPDRIYYPETWFHFIGGNVSKDGITADLEAISEAGFSGVHLFHGQFGGEWPGEIGRAHV